jgi:murein DD-endopeptidase MepM/ murein hydrolase activator NlpD
LSDLTAKLRRLAASFSKTKLCAQVVAASVLTIAGALVLVLPVRALEPLRSAVVWTVSYDYDFSGQGQRAQTWASQHGGWLTAAHSAWGALGAQVRPWMGVETVGRPDSRAVPAARLPRDPIMPVEGAVLMGFGWVAPGGAEEFHEGLDLAVPIGTPVVAAAEGVVMEVRTEESLGQVVEINHGQVIGVYAQLGSVGVVAGQQVAQGERIGLVGPPAGDESTLPPHLHFESLTMNGRVPVDPAAYLGLGGRKL